MLKANYGGFWIRSFSACLELIFIGLVYATAAFIDFHFVKGEFGLFPYYDVVRQEVYDARPRSAVYGESLIVKSYEKRFDLAGRQKEVLVLREYGQLPLPFALKVTNSYESVVSEDENWGGRYRVASIVVAILFVAFYPTLMWISPWQATVCGRILGLRLVDYEGKRITIWRSLLRFTAFLLVAPLVIGVLMTVFTRRKQTLHDMIAKTLVVRSHR
jgi:NADH:ubiquinone oxidoreductase subunit 3 (subunit A)